MDINLLNGNVHRYKKESCLATSSFWLAQDASGKIGRSRWLSAAGSVPSNPSLDYLAAPPSTKNDCPIIEQSFFIIAYSLIAFRLIAYSRQAIKSNERSRSPCGVATSRS